MINSYSFGKIIIDDRQYDHDVQVISGQVNRWQRAESHLFSINELKNLISQGVCQGEWPSVIVIGDGHDGMMKVDPAIKKQMLKKGVGLIVEKTGLAKEEFNKMLAEGDGNILGLFHLTC